MGFDKKAFLAALRLNTPNDPEKDPPPPYQENADRSAYDEDDLPSQESPPDYDKSEAKTVPEEKNENESENISGFDTSQPPIPPTAVYLLQRDEESKQKLQATVDYFCGAPDPAIFEFELVCLVCFEYETECLCSSSRPKTCAVAWLLPKAKKANRSFTYPAKLAKEVGERPAHLSSAVAQSLWPAIAQGMIPVFNNQALVVLRSRALERARDPKDILRKMANPVTTLLSPVACWCGCQLTICTKIRTKYRLQDDESLSSCSLTSYKVRQRTFNAVRLKNGITCFDLREMGLYEMNTTDEQDFLLYCSILPTFWNASPSPRPKDNPADINWNMVLESLLHETLTLQNMRMSRYQNLPIRAMCHIDGSTRAVMRAENFGVGPGFLVMEVSPSAPNDWSSNIVECGYSLDHVPSINNPRNAIKEAFMSETATAQPKLGKLDIANLGKGWGSLSLDPRSDGHLYLKKGFGFLCKKTVVGLPRRGLPGRVCSGICSKKKASHMVNFAGFTPPEANSEETTVYILDNDPLSWVVISQWAYNHPKPLFFVSHKECMACTVLDAPTGSIIASGLPPIALFGVLIV